MPKMHKLGKPDPYKKICHGKGTRETSLRYMSQENSSRMKKFAIGKVQGQICLRCMNQEKLDPYYKILYNEGLG